MSRPSHLALVPPPAPPVGVWLIARTSTGERYPCRCGSRCDPRWCPCWGRPDVHDLPAHCCAPRFQPAAAAPAAAKP